MKTDSYFEIGSSHEVCQDYALSGQIGEDIGYAIVTDGCTMSHKACNQVDLGARILAHSARDVLLRTWGNHKDIVLTEDGLKSSNKFIRERSIIMTRMIERQLDLNPLFADCTLLIAVADSRGNAHAMVFGDGSVFVEFKNGCQVIADVSFLSGAPYYLSYHTDPNRKGAYLQEYGEAPVVIDKHSREEIIDEVWRNNQLQVNASDPDLYNKTMFSWEGVAQISVTSDGAKTFLRNKNGETENIGFYDIMGQFNGIKNKNGVFIQRRMKSMGKSMKKDEAYHYDDISIATILTD